MTHTDPRQDYDRLREEGLTRRDDAWVACRYADVAAIAKADDRFSSAVSRFLQVPNGLDGAEHARMRQIIDPFFSAERMAALEPVISEVARELVGRLDRGTVFNAVTEFGARFAVRAQSRWLGWPHESEHALLAWMAENHEATRSGELARTAAVAQRFDEIIMGIVEPRLSGARPRTGDVTDELIDVLRDEPDFKPTLVSVLRNWTGGDLGSIALCVGVIVHWLATHPEHIGAFRGLPDEQLDRAIDEILRIDDPFVSNRRVAAVDTEVDAMLIHAGERVIVNWTGANRDPAVFGDPDRFDPQHNAEHNLVYGTGVHVCPGRPLATLELRVAIRALLNGVSQIRLSDDIPAERAQPPIGGFTVVPVIVS
ncbi:cytochrome P450 [Propionimicrobium sp. PCR01-08-3]|uniref:cytochrome P450 n=1 Tax=Propionimicrobium sp. PCR01-08-3 TaxID=3052086 RepID=UPI00255C6A78|nr:cytochrome P450 [Propionimicrobium sp. PCR01-08-3]WIY82075.1 cytochrome P450 [Propionimicrobium sp. PCR01-08-3]